MSPFSLNDPKPADEPQAGATRKYRVRVGHNHVDVFGSDPSDAVQAARRQFGHELPRLWDVIYTMQESEFDVEEL